MKRHRMRRRRLIAELRRLFNASESAMLCMLSHGQVTVDGYVMKPEFDQRWPAERLRGRYAQALGRTVRLYVD